MVVEAEEEEEVMETKEVSIDRLIFIVSSYKIFHKFSLFSGSSAKLILFQYFFPLFS